MRLWLYSVKCTRLTQGSGFNGLHMLLFCIDERQQTHIVRVSNYQTFISILPNQDDAKRFNGDFSGLVSDIHNHVVNVKRAHAERMDRPYAHITSKNVIKSVIDIESCKNARKLIGYTGSLDHWVLKLMLHNESDRWVVLNSLRYGIKGKEDTTKMRIGEMRIEELLHTSISPESQFLSDTHVRLASWIHLDDCVEDRLHSPFFVQNAHVWTAAYRNIRAATAHDFATTQIAPSPTLRRLYLRIDAYSSTATAQNQFDPNYELAEDCITHVALCTSDDDLDSKPLVFVLKPNNVVLTDQHKDDADTLYFDSELELLTRLGQTICAKDAHVFVIASDERCNPNCLMYLMKRAKRYPKLNLGLSKMSVLEGRCERRVCGGGADMLVLEHHGTERIDICRILPRAMVSPNLDGFTLLDAIRHDNLVDKKYKPLFAKMINLDYTGTNSTHSIHDITDDLRMNVSLLRVLEHSRNLLLNQQDIASMCFLDITSVCERGQQMRVGGLFVSRYHGRNIIMNEEQAKQPFVVVNLPRHLSSYPRPPWLQNPPPEAMRGEKRPGQIISEKIPEHVQFLVQDEQFKEHHNNVYTYKEKEAKIEEPSVVHDPQTRDHVAGVCDQLAELLLSHATERLEQVPMAVDDDEHKEDEFKSQVNVDKKEWWKGKRKLDFVKKSRKKIKTAAEKDNDIAYRGGSVLDPLPGYYYRPEEAAMTVDFTSLYPSIMRAYRICYMRVIYDRKWLTCPDVELEYVPITETQCVVLAKRHRINGQWVDVETITPEIVADIMTLRENIKTKLKSVDSSTFEYSVLDSQQLAAKTIANSVYGYTGSKTSRTPCTALAAAITQIGQWMIHTVRFVFLFFGHRALYGDTDSNMIGFWVPSHLQTKDEIMTWIVKEGLRVVRIYAGTCVAPNNLEPESIKSPFHLLKKKTYAAIQYKVYVGSWNEKKGCLGECIKGMAAKKRDKCGFAQNIGCELIHKLQSDPNISNDVLLQWFREEIRLIPLRQISDIKDLNPFIITCSLNSEYKNADSKAIKALHLAQLTEMHSGARPRVGSRIPYVVTYKPKVKLQSQWCEIPPVFFANNSVLHVEYILRNHVLNVLKQILALPIHQALLSMFETCIEGYVTRWKNIQNKQHKDITCYFGSAPRFCS